MHRALQHGHGPDDEAYKDYQIAEGDLEREEEANQNGDILGGEEDQNNNEAELIQDQKGGEESSGNWDKIQGTVNMLKIEKNATQQPFSR